jgi:UDP-galactopyranose mutase
MKIIQKLKLWLKYSIICIEEFRLFLLSYKFNDNYINHFYQGIPKFGYIPIFENILNHKNISPFFNFSFLKKKSKNLVMFFIYDLWIVGLIIQKGTWAIEQ